MCVRVIAIEGLVAPVVFVVGVVDAPPEGDDNAFREFRVTV